VADERGLFGDGVHPQEAGAPISGDEPSAVRQFSHVERPEQELVHVPWPIGHPGPESPLRPRPLQKEPGQGSHDVHRGRQRRRVIAATEAGFRGGSSAARPGRRSRGLANRFGTVGDLVRNVAIVRLLALS
jgi:hypothetical protein